MKCKICPVCGKINIVSRILCDDCKEDLMQVVPVPVPKGAKLPESGGNESDAKNGSSNSNVENVVESSSNSSGENVVERSESKKQVYGRRCPSCKAVSPYRQKICSCGTLLLTQPPVLIGEGSQSSDTEIPDGSEEAKQLKQEEAVLYFLRTEDGKFRLPLSEGDDLELGRKAAAGVYLQDKSFVSGRHIRVKVTDGEVVITHIGTTNPTLVNGRELRYEKPYRICEGDLLALGAKEGQGVHKEVAYFRLIVPDENG